MRKCTDMWAGGWWQQKAKVKCDRAEVKSRQAALHRGFAKDGCGLAVFFLHLSMHRWARSIKKPCAMV